MKIQRLYLILTFSVPLIIFGAIYFSGLWLYGLAYVRNDLTPDIDVVNEAQTNANINYYKAVVLAKITNNGYLVGTQTGLMEVYLSTKTGKKILIDQKSLNQKEIGLLTEYLELGQLSEEQRDESNIFIQGEGEIFDELVEKGSILEFYYNELNNEVTVVTILIKRIHV